MPPKSMLFGSGEGDGTVESIYKIEITRSMMSYATVSELFFAYVYGTLLRLYRDKTDESEDNETSGYMDNINEIITKISDMLNIIFAKQQNDPVTPKRLEKLSSVFDIDFYIRRLADLSKRYFGYDFKKITLNYPQITIGTDRDFIMDYIRPNICNAI